MPEKSSGEVRLLAGGEKEPVTFGGQCRFAGKEPLG